MILDNLTRALKSQNWFAAGIEFVIVIVGVVIGFQITAWNEDRAEQASEQSYLQRLHDEAVYGLEGILQSTDRRWTEAFALSLEVMDILAEEPAQTLELSEDHCAALVQLNSIIAFPYQFPTLKEILASGRLSVIEDERLRTALTDYDIMQENSRSLVSYYSQRGVALPLDFPNLVRSAHVASEGSVDQRYFCDLDGMRADPDFIANFHHGMTRFEGYYRLVLRGEVDSVRGIYDQIRAKTGIVTTGNLADTARP